MRKTFINFHGGFIMKYNFDKVVDRNGTRSVKWDFVHRFFREEDLLPLWVADMDFQCPKPVIDALEKRVKHGIFGYSSANTEDYHKAVIGWMKRRHNWDIDRKWIVYTPGVVPALAICVQTFTEPGDKVIIQRPVYYPFTNVIVNNNRIVLNNSLKYKDGKYTIDFDDLEEKVKDPKVKLMLFCSPHNPVGRVWTEEELIKVGNICLRNNVILVSDEIHGDLIHKGYKHIPLISLSKEFEINTIVCTAPSKTFNMAGLHMSNIIIPNEKLRKKYRNTLQGRNATSGPNPLGIEATIAAYNHGDEWLEQVLEYIGDNINYIKEFCQERLPGIKFIKPEGTYLVWLDFKELGLDKEELTEIIIKKAKVALNEGHFFGDEGTGFQRINVACPRSILVQCMERIERELRECGALKNPGN